MTDDSTTNNESQRPKKRPSEKSHPISDSRLTPVQRVVREHYSSRANSEFRSERQYESGELSLIAYSAEKARMVRSLSEASIGIEHFIDYRNRIQRGFSAGAQHYMLGAEFAITAIIMMAGIARRRADLSGAGMTAVTEQDTASGATRPTSKARFDNSVLTGRESKFKLQDVPDWLISLDGSVAAEAGYLFASILKRPTILMTMQDTFVSLGENHFHDAVLGWLIVDLNARKLKEIWKGQTKVVAVRSGETIELPVWEDIVEFYQNKPRDAKPDNLLTVVLKRSLDRELVDAAFASLVVPGSVNLTDARIDSSLAGEWIVKRSGTYLRIHRMLYENLNSWAKMEKYLTKRQIERTV